MLPLLYKSMVRPHLEYGNVIWGPHYKGDQQIVEKVQKRATKLIPNLRHLPYKERLKMLKLPSLMYRRRRGDMLETFNIITDKVNVNKDAIFKFNVMPTRGHQYKVFKPISTKFVRTQCFSHRVINDWNSLPQEVVSAQTVNEFKTKLDKCWKEHQYKTPFE
jgi:ribonuclease P/MRP protein subunit RPP40